MKGTIRFVLGLLIVMGAAGTADVEPAASLLNLIGWSLVGLGLMYSGVIAMNKQLQEEGKL